MNFIHALIVGLGFTTSVWALQIGDTAEQVEQELGQPSSRMEAGKRTVLVYPEVKVVLEEGKVTELKRAVQDKPSTNPVRPALASDQPAPRPQPQVPHAGNSAPWITDYSAALQQAKSDKTKVFLFFTGSDWCGWCVRLKKEVLSQPEFLAYAQSKLVLVDIDFPKRAPQPESLKQQNEQLAGQYGIEGFPTVVVLNSSGREIGRLGYQQGGPSAYIASLEKLR